MERSIVAKRVKKVVADAYDLPESCIEENDTFSSLGDSLETINASMNLEDEFKCKIPDAKARKIKTVGDAIDYFSHL